MSKIKKSEISKKSTRKTDNFAERFAYRTVIISMILSGICLIISLLFNGQIISFTSFNSTFLNILEILIRVFSILGFALFIIISIGNYKELTGKPITWKELLLIIVLSLIQSLLNAIVFAFTFISLIFIMIYLFLIQER